MDETERASQRAGQALADFAEGPARDAADLAAQSFEQAGERIARSLEQAARSGEFSFRDMAAAITRDLASLAIRELLLEPLGAALGGGQSGGAAQTANPLNIVMNITGVNDASSFQKSQGQISASLARAVAQGQKFI
ncbi:MAG: hypothetical protein JKY25_11485 [Robiginitomaculum sp.]|nr:hypothetical protein [Robiginitomaculum sp.]